MVTDVGEPGGEFDLFWACVRCYYLGVNRS